jgi:hypothetical protein
MPLLALWLASEGNDSLRSPVACAQRESATALQERIEVGIWADGPIKAPSRYERKRQPVDLVFCDLFLSGTEGVASALPTRKGTWRAKSRWQEAPGRAARW